MKKSTKSTRKSYTKGKAELAGLLAQARQGGGGAH